MQPVPKKRWHYEALRLEKQGLGQKEIAETLRMNRDSIHLFLNPYANKKHLAWRRARHKERFATDEAYRNSKRATVIRTRARQKEKASGNDSSYRVSTT